VSATEGHISERGQTLRFCPTWGDSVVRALGVISTEAPLTQDGSGYIVVSVAYSAGLKCVNVGGLVSARVLLFCERRETTKMLYGAFPT